MQSERTKAVLRTLSVCLIANLTVAGLKLFFGLTTQTLSFFADGIHSLFDAMASVLGIISVIQSEKPPDEGHPYGHKKFEIIAAVGLALLLGVASFEVATLAWERFYKPLDSHITYWAVVVLIFNLAVNLLISRFEARQAKRYQSSILFADALHTESDVWVTLAVLASLGANYFGVRYVDSVFSILIALYLAYLSIKLIISNFEPLVDSRVLDSNEVRSIVTGVPGVIDCHHIRSRGEKNYHFLDLNIHLDGKISLDRAHEITHLVEKRLKESFQGLADVVIHTEPHDHPPCF